MWVATDGGLRVLDPTTNTIRASVPLPSDTSVVAITPDGRHVYAVEFDGTVVDVDPATLAVSRRFGTAPRPTGATISPDGTFLAVGSGQASAVDLIDLATGTSRARVPVGTVTFTPAITADDRTLFAAVPHSAAIEVVDVPTGRVTTTIPVMAGAVNVALSPDGRYGYAHDDGNGGQLQVIDTATNRVVQSLPVPSINSAETALSPDGSRAYVVDQGAGTLAVVALR